MQNVLAVIMCGQHSHARILLTTRGLEGFEQVGYKTRRILLLIRLNPKRWAGRVGDRLTERYTVESRSRQLCTFVCRKPA